MTLKKLSQIASENLSFNYLSNMENLVLTNGDDWILDLYGFQDFKNG